MPTGTYYLQLEARNKEDKVLTGNPQITFFTNVYKRHSNFSKEFIENYFSTNLNFGMKVFCMPIRAGDLIHRIYVEFDLPSLDFLNTDPNNPVSWINNVGNAIIREYSIVIGDTEIDRQYGLWLDIWNELTVNAEKKDAYYNLVGYYEFFNNSLQKNEKKIVVYLNFWFNTNIGLSLPLLAIQNQDIKIYFELRRFDELVTKKISQTTQARLTNARIWMEYIFLDNDERVIFTRKKNTYLITQLKYFSVNWNYANTNIRIPLPFTHPVKEIIWTLQIPRNVFVDEFHWNNLFNYTSSPDPTNINRAYDIMLESNFWFNGTQLFDNPRPARFFRYIQPYTYHKNAPITRYYYIYSFALKPEDYQPSGTLNMGALDSKELQIIFNSTTDKAVSPIQFDDEIFVSLYATNYNVLTVSDGLALLENVG